MPDTQTPPDQKPVAAPPGAPAAPAQGAARANASKGPPKRVLVIVGLIAAVALFTGGRMWYRSHYFVDTDNAYVAGHVHPVSPRIAGVVTRVLFEDNQVVRAGTVLAELDPADQRVRIDQIQAQILSVQQQIVQGDAAVEQARDAGVLEPRQDAALVQEASHESRRGVLQQLERDALLELSVGPPREEDPPHPAAPDLAHDLERSDAHGHRALGRRARGGAEHRDHGRGRAVEEPAIEPARVEQTEHLGTQRVVVAAGAFDVRRLLGPGQVECGVEDRVGAAKAVGRRRAHDVSAGSGHGSHRLRPGARRRARGAASSSPWPSRA